MQQGCQAYCLKVLFANFAARPNNCIQHKASVMQRPEGMRKTRVVRTGKDEVGEPQLPHIVQALEHPR